MPAPRKPAPPRKSPPKTAPVAPKPKFNLRTFGGALGAILLLRVILGLWALPISARFPETMLEKRIAIWPPSAPLEVWSQRVLVKPWVRYDALHYASIVQRGYNLRVGQSAFHPLFPLLGWPLVRLGLPPSGALLLISTLASVLLCLTFARYVAKFHGDAAQGAPALLFGGLCGFLLLAPYNESLFLVLALGSIWAMRDNRLWLAGALGGLAALTRQQGLALVLPLMWQIGATRRWRDAFSVALIFAGYGAFVIYRLRVLHDFDPARAHGALELVRGLLVSPASQNMVGGQHLAWPWQTVAAQWQRLTTTPNPYHLATDLFLGGAMVFLALCGWKNLHPTERLFALTIALLSLCYFNGLDQPLLSFPRHMMLAFPLYITLARWASKTPARGRLTLEIAFALNLFLAAAYFRNGWVP